MPLIGTQLYRCVTMIPDFNVVGNLPAGEHPATWQELLDRFGYTPWRCQLLAGLREALLLLRAAGCRRAYIDGSRLLTFDSGRATQKAAFHGELYMADSRADPQGRLFLDFFQTDRDGNRKGILVVDLKDLP